MTLANVTPPLPKAAKEWSHRYLWGEEIFKVLPAESIRLSGESRHGKHLVSRIDVGAKPTGIG